MRIFLSCLSAAVLFPAIPLVGSDTIYLEASATAALSAKEGQKIVVYGETTGSEKNATGTNFVRFKDAEFLLVTFKTDLEPFKAGEPYTLYDGKRLAVEGIISIYQGKPQIKLIQPEQITLLEPDAIFPPVPEKEKSAPEPKPEMTAKENPTEQLSPKEPKRKPPVDSTEYFKK
ncbi:MAG: hypothetical protein KA250_14680 [Verrucomicrobiales bacterium]|jgi:hypothetical protein|nr:hypothetical protein [Verrucomicrobiales bacterium]